MSLGKGVALVATGMVPAMQRYYDKVFLERLQYFQKYNFLAIQKTIPKNSGRVVYFTRMTQLTSNTTALTDGTTPSGISTTAESVIATVNPYGAYEWIGRQFELTTIDAGLKEHVENMGQNAGETMDHLLAMAMSTSGNYTLLCANNAQASGVASTDIMTVSGIRTAVSTLKKALAPKWENGNYRAVMCTDHIYQLQGDTAAGNWINVHMYNSGENAEFIKKGVIGTLYGCDIVESNASVSASSSVDGSQATSGRFSFFAGKGAVAEVKLQGNGDARVIVKKTDANDTSNPLDMYSTVGWKVEGYVAKVLNSDWLIAYAAYGTGDGIQGGV